MNRVPTFFAVLAGLLCGQLLHGQASVQAGTAPTPRIIQATPFPDDGANCQTADLRLKALPETNGDPYLIQYYGRPRPVTDPDSFFTVIGIPDSQYYLSGDSGGRPEMWYAQTRWIVEQLDALNIVYAGHLGDCVEHTGSPKNHREWAMVDSGMTMLEDVLRTGLKEGLPYGMLPGNHDQVKDSSIAVWTAPMFDHHFGSRRFEGRSYYGGTYRGSAVNNFTTFTAMGIPFLVINLGYQARLDTRPIIWADSLLDAHPHHVGMVFAHFILWDDGNMDDRGNVIRNRIGGNPNLRLMFCGHVDGEIRREFANAGGPFHILLSNYQFMGQGGDGYLRIMKFFPARKKVEVYTYSPWLDRFKTDPESRFDLSMSFQPGFRLLGEEFVGRDDTAKGIAWKGLKPTTEYEWYANVYTLSGEDDTQLFYFRTGPQLDLQSLHHICADETVQLVAGSRGPAYAWSDGNRDHVRNLSQGGEFVVEVQDKDGCVDEREIFVDVDPVLPLPGILREGNRLCADMDGNHYTWTRDGEVLPLDRRCIHVFDPGSYRVTVTRGACTSAESEPLIAGVYPLTPTFSIFPNPCRDRFAVVLPPEAEAVQLQLYDAQGRRLPDGHLRTTAVSGRLDAEIFGLAKGVYLLEIVTDSNRRLQKFILY